jgi:hypothetical protein
VKLKAGIGMISYKLSNANDCWPAPEARERQGRTLLQIRGNKALVTPLILDFYPPKLRANKILCYKLPVLWYLVMAVLGNKYREDPFVTLPASTSYPHSLHCIPTSLWSLLPLSHLSISYLPDMVLHWIHPDNSR